MLNARFTQIKCSSDGESWEFALLTGSVMQVGGSILGNRALSACPLTASPSFKIPREIMTDSYQAVLLGFLS